ncbi:L,D-transpeptidase family protein [Defluviitalea phaphyphila]|uniref:L,D-transpeptidase family protein n=1 Tax=Defluviitalea phaphyphila TaxID=1473580 RepID=UPI000730F2BB|nr:L,D-transpeptidase [Defluviitalea phaphyphila]
MFFVADIRKHIKILIVIMLFIGVMIFFKYYNLVLIEVEGDRAIINVNFLIPMEQIGIEKDIEVKSFFPNSKVKCNLKWESENRLRIFLQELSELKGQKVIFEIKDAKSKIPFFTKTFSKSIQFQTEPKLLEIENEQNVPTEGPIILKFNSPMDYKSIHKYIQSDIEFDIKPYKFDNGKRIDYSIWNLYPKEKMKNDSNYLLIIKSGLKAQCGNILKEDIQKQIHTASKPEIIKTFPKHEAKWVALYPKITIEMDEELSDAIAVINGVKQNIKIKDNKLEFFPHDILQPEQEYTINIQGISKYGEKTNPYILKFTTMPLKEDELWVEVSLKEKHEVLIHKGNKIIKKMPASGGVPEEPTVLGTFFIQDRGLSFFSERFKEGATYWVRIIDQYLFHSVPRDVNWNIIESELKKIGKPASHGCVRLLEEDAKWFYENIPEGTMVIIHD